MKRYMYQFKPHLCSLGTRSSTWDVLLNVKALTKLSNLAWSAIKYSKTMVTMIATTEITK